MFENRPPVLVVARHGESVRNEYFRKGGTIFLPHEGQEELSHYGDHEVPLTDAGKAQAAELGIFLARTKVYHFDSAYHSDQLRAKDTLDIVIDNLYCRPKIFHDTRLRERSSGIAYSLTEKQLQKSFPRFQAYWEQMGWFYARPPNGESLADMYEGRVRQVLADIFARHQRERVLIVCHGRTQQVIRLLLDDIPVNTKKRPFGGLDNCGTVVWENGEPGKVIYP